MVWLWIRLIPRIVGTTESFCNYSDRSRHYRWGVINKPMGYSTAFRLLALALPAICDSLPDVAYTYDASVRNISVAGSVDQFGSGIVSHAIRSVAY